MMKYIKFLLLFLLLMIFLSSCLNNENKKYNNYVDNPLPDINDDMEKYYNNLKPVIQGYNGEAFAAGDATIDGYYTGFERLGNNIIYCNDDNSVIWVESWLDDQQKNGWAFQIKRLNSRNITEKLCIFNECRNNTNEACNHLPEINNLCYSNGVLYTTWAQTIPINGIGGLAYVDKSCILRYDIDLGVVDKLIDFENESINGLHIYGRYIYVWLSDSEVQNDHRIVRIDLEEENAVTIYQSTGGELLNFYNWYFYKDRIISGTAWSDLDMQKFTVFMESDDNPSLAPRSICMYNDDIYFLSDENLYRYSMKPKTNKLEFLLDGVYDIYLSGDFLYYTMFEPYEAYRYNAIAYDEDDEYLSVNIVPEIFNNGNKIYRINLEYDYLDFYRKVEIYKSEKDYFLGEWTVQGDYIYATLYTEGDLEFIQYYKNLVRVRINTNYISHLFYKSEHLINLHSKKNVKPR